MTRSAPPALLAALSVLALSVAAGPVLAQSQAPAAKSAARCRSGCIPGAGRRRPCGVRSGRGHGEWHADPRERSRHC